MYVLFQDKSSWFKSRVTHYMSQLLFWRRKVGNNRERKQLLLFMSLPIYLFPHHKTTETSVTHNARDVVDIKRHKEGVTLVLRKITWFFHSLIHLTNCLLSVLDFSILDSYASTSIFNLVSQLNWSSHDLVSLSFSDIFLPTKRRTEGGQLSGQSSQVCVGGSWSSSSSDSRSFCQDSF